MVIRRFDINDSIFELTLLIRRAYKKLADMGLNFTGSYQDDAITLERIEGQECYVAVIDERIVGTVLLLMPNKEWMGWYARDRLAIVGQFAVEPALQNKGIGGRLMDFVERRAIALGLSELALDTAEEATHLIDYYTKRGYRFIEYRQWEGKTYRSVVLSKSLEIAG